MEIIYYQTIIKHPKNCSRSAHGCFYFSVLFFRLPENSDVVSFCLQCQYQCVETEKMKLINVLHESFEMKSRFYNSGKCSKKCLLKFIWPPMRCHGNLHFLSVAFQCPLSLEDLKFIKLIAALTLREKLFLEKGMTCHLSQLLCVFFTSFHNANMT